MDYTDIRSGKYTRVPMYRELRINSFDFMSLVKAMDLKGYCIFLESAGKTRDKGRFSFLCFNPVEIVSEENGNVRVTKNCNSGVQKCSIFEYIDAKLSEHVSPVSGEFGDFNGGYAGYSGSLSAGTLPVDKVSAEFLLIDEFVVFDNHTGKYHVCSVVYPDPADIESAIKKGETRLAELEHFILDMIADERIHFLPSKADDVIVEPAVSDEIFMQYTAMTRDKLAAQGIPLASVSRELHAHGRFSAFSFYMKLRGLSPSPYMYYMHLPHCRIAGSSPETHLKIKNGSMMMKPASGFTAAPQSRQGRSAARRELLRSDTDRGVHSVLVDLARDSLAASALDGTVTVKKFMDIEEYQNRLRIVTRINAILRPGTGIAKALSETLQACSITGMVTGEADSNEKLQVAGRSVAGYFGYNRSCDICVMTGCAVFDAAKAVIQGYALIHASVVADDVLLSAKVSAYPAVTCLGYALRG
ncbi:MAG TPA: chorismate-binding protein [Spirochaetota bacterium]|nr:chorismate-binding protein [Spirochaetota bacterium]